MSRLLRHCRHQCLVVLACIPLVAWSVSAEGAGVHEIGLDHETSYVSLCPLASYIEDTEGTLDFDDVMGPAAAHAWMPVETDTINYGYTNSVIWVRTDLRNRTLKDLEFLIEIAYPVLDDITVHILRKDGTESLSLGDRLPFEKRPIEHRNFVFPIAFSPNESLQIVYRVETTSSMQIPLHLYKERPFFEENQNKMLQLGLYYGSMIIMILYNFFVYLSVREANYLYYVIYVTCMATFLASLNGTTYQFLWPNSTWWNDQVLVVSLSGVVLFALLFTTGFLKIKESHPKSYRAFVVFAVLAGLIILFSYAIPYKVGILSTIVLAVVSIVWCMILTIVRWVEGYSAARFYAVAWFAMLSGGIILALNKFSIFPRNVFTENATQFGSVLEVVLLSFALADRLNTEKKELIEARNVAHLQERNARIANEKALKNERKAREAREHAFEVQKKATETLELRVKERTFELNETLGQVREANNHILASLRYARMIQLSMLPNPEKVKECLPDHFVWWSPRDIVGGDFYYIDEKGGRIIVAVADCTGHGVPGAFMTIIASSELKRIIRGEFCFDTGEILGRMNRRIRRALKQDTTRALSDDGLDIGICVIDPSLNRITYSGARMNLHHMGETGLETVKGDKKSVGYISSKEDEEYTVHTVEIDAPMNVYLFTDGLTDQLGGEKGRRFGTRAVKDLIEKHAARPLGEQRERFETAFEEHRGERDPVDDLTMVAFRLV